MNFCQTLIKIGFILTLLLCLIPLPTFSRIDFGEPESECEKICKLCNGIKKTDHSDAEKTLCRFSLRGCDCNFSPVKAIWWALTIIITWFLIRACCALCLACCTDLDGPGQRINHRHLPHLEFVQVEASHNIANQGQDVAPENLPNSTDACASNNNAADPPPYSLCSNTTDQEQARTISYPHQNAASLPNIHIPVTADKNDSPPPPYSEV